jgi:hypothetical protein
VRIRVGGGEDVALRRGLLEVVRQALEVELFLLAGFEQGFDGRDVRIHIAQGAEVVLVGVVFERFPTAGCFFDGGREGLEGGFDGGFERGEFANVGGEVGVVGFEVCLAAGDTGDEFFDVGEVFVEFVGALGDFDEASIGFVDFGEGVEHGVGDGVEEGSGGGRGAAANGPGFAGACVGAAGAEAHLSVPVRGFEEEEENSGAAEDRVEGAAVDEAVERPGTALGEVCTEAVASDVGHIVFLGKRRDGAGGKVAVEGVAEEKKVCESPSDGEVFFRKRLEVGLRDLLASEIRVEREGGMYMCGD